MLNDPFWITQLNVNYFSEQLSGRDLFSTCSKRFLYFYLGSRHNTTPTSIDAEGRLLYEGTSCLLMFSRSN